MNTQNGYRSSAHYCCHQMYSHIKYITFCMPSTISYELSYATKRRQYSGPQPATGRVSLNYGYSDLAHWNSV